MDLAYRPFHPPPIPQKALLDLQASREWMAQSQHPLSVEVGCGVGLHGIQWGRLHPQKRLLAFERTSEKWQKAQRRWRNNGSPENVRFVHADATVMLPSLVDMNSIDQFYFFYPNPYPKTQHSNLRWGLSPFMSFVQAALKPGGKAHFATNIETYARELVEHLPKRGFTLENFTPIPSDASPRTHFEKKYLRRGDVCFDLVFQSTASS